MGAFRRLLWRELRWMRVLVLALTLSGCVWCLGALITARRADPLTRLIATVGLHTILSGAIIGAGSIAADRRLVRLAVRRGAHLPRGPIFAAKWLACMIVWLGATAVVSAVALLCAPSPIDLWAVLDVALFWGFLGFGCCFAASAAMKRGLAALFVGAGLATLPAIVLHRLFYVSPCEPWDLGLKVATIVLAHLFLLSLAWSMLRAGREPTPTRHPRRVLASRVAALAAAAVGMALLVPVVAYVRTTSLSGRDVTRIERLEVSPDGRFLSLTVQATQRPFDIATRCCVVEPETGATTWLTRLRGSGSRSERGWSPDGRYFAFPTWPCILEKAWLRLAGGEARYRHALGLFDTRTGQRWTTSHPESLYASNYWWASESELDFRARRARFRHHAAERRVECVAPLEARAPRTIFPAWRALWDRQWVLEAPSGWWLRFRESRAPGALGGTLAIGNPKTGEAYAIGHVHSPIERIGPLCSFSASGRWVVYVARPDRGSGPAFWLHEMATGQRKRLNAPRPITHWLPRFTPDETRLVWVHARTTERGWRARTDQVAFQVQELDDEAPRPLPLPSVLEGKAEPLQYGVSNTCAYFVRRQRVYSLRLDGTGCRQVFP